MIEEFLKGKKLAKIRDGFWYFCHPYTTETIEGRQTNFELACERSAKLLLNGYNIFSPVVHSHAIELMSPVLCRESQEWLWDFWLQIDLAIIKYVGFKGIILAPGWGSSRGCRQEYDWFLSHRQPNRKVHDILQYKKIVGD